MVDRGTVDVCITASESAGGFSFRNCGSIGYSDDYSSFDSFGNRNGVAACVSSCCRLVNMERA